MRAVDRIVRGPSASLARPPSGRAVEGEAAGRADDQLGAGGTSSASFQRKVIARTSL